MVHKYPREKKRLVAINGIFDDFSDPTLSSARWFETWTGSNVAVTYPAAPFGGGGNAMKLDGTIADAMANLDAMGGMSPYPNASQLFSVNNHFPYTWKVKAEFRLCITDDEADATHPLACSAGFYMDGNVKHTTSHQIGRAGVFFSVANQKAGITQKNGASVNYSIYDVAWSGALNTYYDIRIEWEWNYFDELTYPGETLDFSKITVKVYVNNSLLFSHSFQTQSKWRNSTGTWEHGLMLGRCGPAINVENHGAAINGNKVTAYFKDIYITTNVRVYEYIYEDSIIYKGATREAVIKIVTATKGEYLIGKGSDVQIYARNTRSANWTGVYRGIVRNISKINRRLISLEAEGYESVLIGEKTDNLSFTTQTAGTIVAAAIHNPTKAIFDTTTYFDATSATYTRSYPYTPKFDILGEFISLENYLLFLDIGNCWHFQSYKTNQSSKRIAWGSSKVYNMEFMNIFIREPNRIRVNGSGVTASRIISTNFADQNIVERSFNRFDLTTQAEVDNALDGYTSIYLEGLEILEVRMRADYEIQRGQAIRVHNPKIGVEETEFIVSNITNTMQDEMILSLIEMRPDVSTILSDLGKRTDATESDGVDIEAALDNTVYIEGIGTVLVSARYIVWNDQTDVVVAEGHGVITDVMLDELVDAFVDGTYTSPMTLQRYMVLGTGTATQANPNDTALDTEVKVIDLTTGFGVIGEIWRYISATSHNKVGMTYGTQGNLSGGTINLTEIGIRDSGGVMFVRATFPVVSIPITRLQAMIYIKFAIKPIPSFMEFGLLNKLIPHMGNPANPLWNTIYGEKPGKAYVVGVESFFPLNIFLQETSETGDNPTIMNNTVSGNFSATKIKTRHLVKYEDDYTFDWSDIYADGDPTGDHPILFFAVGPPSSGFIHSFKIAYRTIDTLLDWDNKLFKLIFTLKFKRGDIGWDHWPPEETIWREVA